MIRQKMFGTVIVAAIFVLMLSSTTIPTTAASISDPHTKVSGDIKTEWYTENGKVYFTRTFISEDMHIKNGFEAIQQTWSINADFLSESLQSAGSNIQTNVEFEILEASKAQELRDYYISTSEGIPTHMYQKWSIITSDMPDIANGNSGDKRSVPMIQPMTHLPNWAGKDTSVWTKYDPIDVIWDDASSRTDPLIDDVKAYMSNNGWQNSPCAGSADLFVNIPGRGWVVQDAHRWIDLGGCAQYHVRMWYIDGDQVIGAAHVEDWHGGSSWNLKHIYITDGVTKWENGANIFHGPHDFELGEDKVRDTFSGRWLTSSNSHWMSNEYKREQYNPLDGSLHVSAYNNGYASVIHRTS